MPSLDSQALPTPNQRGDISSRRCAENCAEEAGRDSRVRAEPDWRDLLDVQRPLRIYAADYSSSGISKAGACTKHQRSNMKLIPGCFLFWCMDCSKCVGWNMMHRYALAVPHVNVAELFGALMISLVSGITLRLELVCMPRPDPSQVVDWSYLLLSASFEL